MPEPLVAFVSNAPVTVVVVTNVDASDVIDVLSRLQPGAAKEESKMD